MGHGSSLPLQAVSRGVKDFKILFLVLLIAVFTGCAAQQKIHTSIPLPDKSQLISHLKERSSIKTLKAIASVEISRDDYQYSSKVIIAAKSPNLFRIEFLNILNQPSAILTNNGIEHLLYYSGNFYREDAFPQSFPLKDLQYLLFYIIGWSYMPIENISGISIDNEKNLYVIDMNADNLLHRIWLSPDDYAIIRREVYDRDGKNIITMVFEGYKEAGDGKFPSSIKITAAPLNINIRYERVELNKEVDDALFFLIQTQ
ncbi:MAG: DUF4292 domain-containing protein [Deltaproteobacteria bacterium]|nr:DUF4292 domain-containing protein [Deltaproteobacteria bacterium]